MIKYWLKVISSEETKYTKQIYKMLLSSLETQPLKLNWALLVKDSLCKLGFMQVWLFQGVINEQRFVAMFQTMVKDIFMQDWLARLETSARARFYNTFANFCYQNYLDDINVEGSEQVWVNWDYLRIGLRWKVGDGRNLIKYHKNNKM